MLGTNGNSRAGRFFNEKSNAGTGFVAVLLVILLTLALLAAFPLYAVSSAFEQGGLRKSVKIFLQEDDTREQIAGTLRDALPEEVISDRQIDTLLSDDTILEAAGQFLYDTIQSEPTDSVELVGNMLEALDDPANAALYGEALDRLTETLEIDDETYRKALEAIAEEQDIRLPEDKNDKLALTSAVLENAYEEMREESASSETPPTATAAPNRDREELAILVTAQKVLARLRTPYFLLYNLLTVAVLYGLFLLLKRSYRKPFLHCAIPYAIAGVFLLALRLLVRPIIRLAADDIPFAKTLAQSAENALTRSMLFAFLFALPLLAAYIVLTVIRRRNRSRPGGESDPAPQDADASPAETQAPAAP